MAVIIGSARHDENGGIHGKAGDQANGTEVSMQDFYFHKKVLDNFHFLLNISYYYL